MDSWSPYRDELVQSHGLRKDGFWGNLVVSVGRAAAESASNEYEREDIARQGLSVIDTLAAAVNDNWWDRDEDAKACSWRHHERPMLANKQRNVPYIIRIEVEQAAAEYLALPYRVDAVDRLLVDMLMAAEMFAFADEVQPQLNQKLPTLLSWVWGNLKSLAIGLGAAALLIWLAPNSTVAQWVAAIVAVLTILGTVLSLILFPFFYPSARAQRQKFTATVLAMTDAYRTLGGTPASVPHIRKMVDRAVDVGVVWPAPLMALLDDIEERRKSI